MLFRVLNNGANASILTSANLSKSPCMIQVNMLLLYILPQKRKPQKKNSFHAFSAQIFSKPFLTPKEGLC